jgi:hypothetical protein
VFKEAKGGVVNRLVQHCRQKPVATTEAQPMPPIANGIRLRTAPTLINETLKGFRTHHDIFSCLSCLSRLLLLVLFGKKLFSFFFFLFVNVIEVIF